MLASQAEEAGSTPVSCFAKSFLRKQLTKTDNSYNIIKSDEDSICDSGVVGNARPCQGRDRGFEPRLSLSHTKFAGILEKELRIFLIL